LLLVADVANLEVKEGSATKKAKHGFKKERKRREKRGERKKKGKEEEEAEVGLGKAEVAFVLGGPGMIFFSQSHKVTQTTRTHFRGWKGHTVCKNCR